ncbi:isopenicillin N synthase family dioxygenase [Bradyrhizobium prioriisuperbiae]|uniref:isopenicillin N synthase family dioxygenase n=1 Tax=Bradyrhizobium prioriisuperbiae TaxID=2854389 RepID=UPI0028EE6B20|nr:2-oxoglutarate and iron-dependent oxygenase domain-containing protein [Bradyrhizobium prioritasuperba]
MHSSSRASRTATAEEIPILDLALSSQSGGFASLAQKLRSACQTYGFFYVCNHGIPREISDAAFAASRRYFALPFEEKLKDKIDERFRRGFMPQGINQHAGHVPDLHESFDFMIDLPVDDPDVAAGLPLHGPNRWPSAHPWLREASEAYLVATIGLGQRLLKLFAASLSMDDEFFLRFCRKPMVAARLLHYLAQSAEDNGFGAAPHTDFGMITILAQDDVGGLEIQKRDGKWIGAPFIPDTFVVNLGDLFKIWTNDVYVSNPHRVIAPGGRERFSIPMFFNLDYRTPVQCLDVCLREGDVPKYKPTTSGDYLLGRYREVLKYD